MQINFRAAFQDFSNKLSDSLLINIKFCAHELSKRCPEKMVAEAQLTELKESVYALYQDVQKADLDPSLSRYLLDHLYLMIAAIDNYLLTGTRGIEHALDATVGSILTNHSVANQAKESEFGEAFWKVIGKAAVILQLAKTAMELGEGVFKLLPGK